MDWWDLASALCVLLSQLVVILLGVFICACHLEFLVHVVTDIVVLVYIIVWGQIVPLLTTIVLWIGDVCDAHILICGKVITTLIVGSLVVLVIYIDIV